MTSTPCCWHLANVHFCEGKTAARIFVAFLFERGIQYCGIKVFWTLYSLPFFSVIHREYLFAKSDIITMAVTEILDKTPRSLVNSHRIPIKSIAIETISLNQSFREVRYTLISSYSIYFGLYIIIKKKIKKWLVLPKD